MERRGEERELQRGRQKGGKRLRSSDMCCRKPGRGGIRKQVEKLHVSQRNVDLRGGRNKKGAAICRAPHSKLTCFAVVGL